MLSLAALRYVDSTPTGAGAHTLSFRRESRFGFSAGQHALWVIPQGGVAPFSFSSSPGDALVELATSLHQGSRIKAALGRLRPGDRVRLLGPLGHLAPPTDGRPVVLVSQGIGVTAARSILREDSGAHRVLVHVGAHHFSEETLALADRAFYPADRETFTTHLSNVTAEHPDAHFLLIGTRTFVRETATRLRNSGIPSSRIRRDPFYGASELGSVPAMMQPAAR